MKKIVTIFTPTYNRKELLSKLYNSLKKQTSKNFVWLIIDDGSSDGTEELINKFKEENKVEIKYYKQKNSGKYIAHNNASKMLETELFCCIDSDDYLVDNAVEIIEKEYNKEDNYLGYVFPRNDEIKLKGSNEIDISDLKYYYKKYLETAIVIKKEVLKKYSFPENKTEKFMSEEVLYNMMSEAGKFKLFENVIAKGEYQENGLTKNIYKLWKNNYNNTMLLFKSRYNFLNKYTNPYRLVSKCKCIINCNIVNIMSKNKVLKNTPSKILSILLIIPSIIYYTKLQKEVNK